MRHFSLIAVFLLAAACLATLLGLPVFAFLAFPLLLASIGRAGIKLIPLLWDKTGGSRDLSILHNKSPRPMPVVKPPAESPLLDGITGILWLVVAWHYRHLVVFGIIGVGLGGFRASLILQLGLAVPIAVVLYLAFDYLDRKWRFADLILAVLFAAACLIPVGWLRGAGERPAGFPGSITTDGSPSFQESLSPLGRLRMVVDTDPAAVLRRPE
jgi:hypothetical protein